MTFVCRCFAVCESEGGAGASRFYEGEKEKKAGREEEEET